MKTTVIGSGKNTAVTAKANNNNNNGATAKAESTNPNPQTANGGIAPSKTFDTNGKADNEPKKAENLVPVPATEQPKPQTEQPNEVKPETPKAEAEQPKAEPTKAELREELATQKPVLNLESTLKLVEELHRRKVQRDRLIGTINNLDTFEIAQKEDSEETDSNYYQGCVLTIEDDDRRKFSTKNPVIIQAVAQFVNHMCVNRLAEIEAGIIIPA